jgi:ABC-type transport system substrate-binding protein
VELITSKPAPLLLNKLTFIGIVPENWQQLEERPMGTGAYCFQRYEKGATLELLANPNFWGGRPRIKKAIFVKLPDDSSRCWALLNGDVQLIRDTGERFADKIKNSPQVNFLSRPGLGVTLLGVNLNLKSPLLKRQVRQAIYLALDPAELVSESKAEAEPTDQLVTPYIVGYLPDLPPQRPMLAKARKLMAAAGYPRGFAMDIEMSKTAAQRSGPYIAKQLKQLGINVNVKGLDWGNMFRRLDRGVSPFFLVGWSNSSGDASDLLEACLHTRERGRYGNANWGGYSNARLDRIIEQSQASIDSRERVQLMQQAMKMALDDMPWIPLYVRSRTYGASAKINFVPRQDGRVKVFEISYIE